MSGFLIYRAVNNGKYDHAALYGGFLALLLGLIGAIGFVLFEADRLNQEDKKPADVKKDD